MKGPQHRHNQRSRPQHQPDRDGRRRGHRASKCTEPDTHVLLLSAGEFDARLACVTRDRARHTLTSSRDNNAAVVSTPCRGPTGPDPVVDGRSWTRGKALPEATEQKVSTAAKYSNGAVPQ